MGLIFALGSIAAMEVRSCITIFGCIICILTILLGYGTWIRGSRQVLVKESMLQDLSSLEIDTWIRLETQEVVGAVTLNSTYGEDHYPATKDTHTHCPTCE